MTSALAKAAARAHFMERIRSADHAARTAAIA
jgi:hypothetical protein